MTKGEQIRDLADQIDGAMKAKDDEEAIKLANRIERLGKPASFSASWGFTPAEAGSKKEESPFMDAWGFVPKERR